MLLISDLLTGKLVAGMLSWESSANESDGLATYFLRWLRDGQQLATGNLIGHKPPGACHAGAQWGKTHDTKHGNIWGIVVGLFSTENEADYKPFCHKQRLSCFINSFLRCQVKWKNMVMNNYCKKHKARELDMITRDFDCSWHDYCTLNSLTLFWLAESVQWILIVSIKWQFAKLHLWCQMTIRKIPQLR